MTKFYYIIVILIPILVIGCTSTKNRVSRDDTLGNEKYKSLSLEKLKDKALKGDDWAQLQLSLNYMKTDDSVKKKESVYWLTLAVDQGNLDAIYLYGYIKYRSKVIHTKNEGLELIRKCAKKGHAVSQAQLGIISISDLGKDYESAYYWFEKAANQKNSQGINGLGYLYLKGYGVRKDYKKAFNYFNKAIKYGNANAYANLASMYAKGNGVPYNKALSIKYYKIAVESDVPEALINMGMNYSRGTGVEKNEGKAFRYFERAAKGGSLHAKYNIATMYHFGEYVKIDYEKAYELFHEIHKVGNKNISIYNSVTYYLGLYNYAGFCFSENYNKAYEYFTEAAQMKHYKACGFLGDMYKNGLAVSVDKEKALEWYMKSWIYGAVKRNRFRDLAFDVYSISNDIERESPIPYYKKGLRHYHGIGVSVNYTEAYHNFLKAGLAENAKAQNYLGIMHFNGQGVVKDDLKAMFWFKSASRYKHPEAMALLGVLYTADNIKQRDYEKAYLWCLRAKQYSSKTADDYLSKIEKKLSQLQIKIAKGKLKRFNQIQDSYYTNKNPNPNLNI